MSLIIQVGNHNYNLNYYKTDTNMKAHRIIVWILFAFLAYYLIAPTLSSWISLPDFGIGNIGFTILFTAFSISHAGYMLGWKRTLIFFLLSASISWIYEQIGVATGMIYGSYHYSDMLGYKLGHVPILIPLAWFMMIYPAWCVGGALLGATMDEHNWKLIIARAWVAAMVATMWDTVMDPGMAAAGNWVWHDSGSYFGVPFQNYFGWVLTTFTIYLVTNFSFRILKENKLSTTSKQMFALPVVVYTLYTLVYLSPRADESLNALRVVAAFTMGFAGTLAILRILLNKYAHSR
ncbi:MAG: carotenoid biosynthesis protein [Lutibacter sp.]|nr:carotenoid biosynthesis protein [Lutibacter sp.]